MIIYKNEKQKELIRESCTIVNDAIAEVAKVIKPGMTTMQLNDIAEKYILSQNATPGFKNYNGFPYACCISVNDAVVHGFPTHELIKDGDVVSVDVGAYINSYHGDSAYTFAVGNISDDVKKLLRVTKEALYLGINKAVSGNRVGDIAAAIQDYTEKVNGYGIVRELVGHGLGKDLHEDPQVPNYGQRGTGTKLKPGLVIAIEPMINMGGKEVYNDKDGWTVRTSDGKPAAHYEHTVFVQKKQADILSSFDSIEAAEKSNSFLCSDY